MRFAPIIACAVLLSGCNFKAVPDPALSARDTAFMALVPDAEFDPHFARYQVTDPTKEQPGTIVIETMERQLYLV
ncbi:MAG: L,D-transpeptidase, partial [Methylobacterium sp.]